MSVLLIPSPRLNAAERLDAFTEPYRSIDVASPETGIIVMLAVHEGDHVARGDVLAQLDQDVFEAMLAIARQAMQSHGDVDSALAEVRLREDRLSKLQLLRQNGNARQEEVQRAEADLTIAEARVRSARESLLIKKLEYERIRTQLERRTLRAPIGGVIARIHKDEGEYVSPGDPTLLTLVQLDPLQANFSLRTSDAAQLRTGQAVSIHWGDTAWAPAGAADSAQAAVELIDPVTDAESGTVRVKVRIENPQGRFRSGERCTLVMPSG